MLYKFGSMNSNLQLTLSQRFTVCSLWQKRGIHKENIYEKLNIPPKPKKPMTPFFKFLSQVRPILVKEFPQVKNTELVKIAAQRWGSVDSALKERLTKEYQEENNNYLKIKEEFEKQLTPENKAAIERAKQHALDLKEERKTKRRSQELGKPKRPISSFFRYLYSRSNDKSKYPGPKEWIKAVSEDWRKLSPDLKAKYEEERKHEYEKWLIELKNWEQKMIKEGNVDVVRTSSLVSTDEGKLKK